MCKYFILSVLMFSLITIGNGQATGSLQGKVIDIGNDEGLPFANVEIEKNDSTILSTQTDFDGNYNFSNVIADSYTLSVSYVGFPTVKIEGVVIKLGQVVRFDVEMEEVTNMEEVVVRAYRIPLIEQDATSGGRTLTAEDIKSLPTRSITSVAATAGSVNRLDEGEAISSAGSRTSSNLVIMNGSKRRPKAKRNRKFRSKGRKLGCPTFGGSPSPAIITQEKASASTYGITSVEKPSNEEYGTFVENEYIAVQDEALSTFSIDVDRASYSNLRRHLTQMQQPPKDAIRIEEMVNYFKYDYPQPKGEHPFTMTTEMTACPWSADHQLLQVGLQGKTIDNEKLPPSNLVFLLDVSGSMNSANKLPLLPFELHLYAAL